MGIGQERCCYCEGRRLELWLESTGAAWESECDAEEGDLRGHKR